MRLRRPAVLAGVAAVCALAPSVATAAPGETLQAYEATITRDDLGALASVGTDMLEVNFNAATDGAKAIELDLYEEQAAKLRDEGIDLTPMDLPAFNKLPKAVKMAVAPKAAPPGDSPNPYYLNFRSYSEPGGIADQTRAVAAANPDTAKLETIGPRAHQLLLTRTTRVSVETLPARSEARRRRCSLRAGDVSHSTRMSSRGVSLSIDARPERSSISASARWDGSSHS